MADKISFVLVLKRTTHLQKGDECDNLLRFLHVGMPTYERYLKLGDVADFFVIMPKDELAEAEATLRAAYPSFPWRFMAEDELVTTAVPTGWPRQQTAKLAIADHVRTPHYVIVDDDTFLVRPFCAADATDARGRAILNKAQIDFPYFFLWSAQVIDALDDFDTIQMAPCVMGITPQIFQTTVVKDIVRYLEHKYGLGFADAATRTEMWQKALHLNKYTEYALMASWLLKQRRMEEVYAVDANAMVYDYAVTSTDVQMHVMIAKAFSKSRTGPTPFYFSFVQSSLPYSWRQVRDAVQANMERFPPSSPSSPSSPTPAAALA